MIIICDRCRLERETPIRWAQRVQAVTEALAQGWRSSFDPDAPEAPTEDICPTCATAPPPAPKGRKGR